MSGKTSTQIGSISKIVGEEKAIEYVAKAGFTAWDFSMTEMYEWHKETNSLSLKDHPLNTKNYLSFARKLKNVATDNGIFCNQSHAPFPSDKPAMFDYLLRAIECTAEVGGEICVIHPATKSGLEGNAELFGKLLPFAKQHNVKIATENVWHWDKEKDQQAFAMGWNPETLNAILDLFNDEYLVACLDVGHAEMKGNGTSAVEMIRALGNRLKALHIHDNDKWHDSHQIPFSMDIDFYSVAKALKEINYTGDFTLEVTAYLCEYTKENVFDGVKDLFASIKKFKDIYEKI
ncbi:MAG: sugar phosphate isomerase/epimerase [Clostridia bacterium]|nr:sugar phosphate isomerase/epimerase [Clostridia bacterium]